MTIRSRLDHEHREKLCEYYNYYNTYFYDSQTFYKSRIQMLNDVAAFFIKELYCRLSNTCLILPLSLT